MQKYKRIAQALVALSFVIHAGAGYAAEEAAQKVANKKASSVQSPIPIVVEADKLYFSDATGNLNAQGNVVIVQGKQKVYAQEVKGNTKETQIWIDDKANLVDPLTNITGLQTRYNYGTKTGTMLKAGGKVGREHVAANNIEFFPDKYILYDGTMTKCPAKVPDYHISAEKVVIWPGDKLIAYNAKFWVKNTVIYTRAVYQKSLKDDQSEMPQIGYSNDDGFYIKQYFEYPLGGNVGAFGDIGYYTKHKFRSAYGIIDRERNFDLSLVHGHYQDGDGRWIKKEPEARFDYKSHRVGNLPVSYTFSAIYGKWTDSTRSSWHQNYILYFTRDPIKLSKSLTLNLGTGYEITKESFDSSTTRSFRYNTSLHKTWTPKFSTWTGYNYTQNNTSTLFDYNRVNVGRELVYGFTYRMDHMNTFTVSQSYDLNKGQVYETYYTWHRNLHCWQMTLDYKAKEKRLQWNISVTRW